MFLKCGQEITGMHLFFPDLFDPHDDRDDDVEGESVEEHKSVIMHLLSQVRLGMDLTKVRLFEFLETITQKNVKI